MKYGKTVTLKDGSACTLRNGTEKDGQALALYRSAGFAEYGRNPRGIKLRDGGYRGLVLMQLELDG